MKKFLTFLCAVTLVLELVGIAGATLITNGDFETGDLSGWTAHNVVASTDGGGNTIAKFNVPDGSGYASLSQNFYVDPDWDGITVDFDVRFASGTNVQNPSADWFKETAGLDVGNGYAWAWKYKFITHETTPGWAHVQTYVPFKTFAIEDTDPTHTKRHGQ